MKFSRLTVFLILLGVFVAFCILMKVKSRLTEGMTEDEEENAAEPEKIDDETFPSPDFEHRPVDKLEKTPQHMDPKKKNKNVEPFTSLADMAQQGLSLQGVQCTDVYGGKMVSVFGCCSDGTPKSDFSGTNCVAGVTCNFGTCDNSKVCKVDASGSNCGKPITPDGVVCLSAKGPIRSGYGCCMDGSPMTDASGKNCAAVVACNYGYCPNSSTCKVDAMGSNCSSYPPPLPQTCTSTVYGCCPDGVTTKNADGSNCYPSSNTSVTVTQLSPPPPPPPPTPPPPPPPPPTPVQPTEMYAGITPYNTSTVLIPPPLGGAASCPKPQPCPPCARCPEPAFDCKKVPNYDRTDNEKFVPQAVLTDFSTFGM